MILKLTEATKWIKCKGCGEQIRTCERFLQVIGRKSEKYCLACEHIAVINNEDLIIDDDDDDGEADLRSREEYAAYQAAGCVSEYWNDRDAGYAS